MYSDSLKMIYPDVQSVAKLDTVRNHIYYVGLAIFQDELEEWQKRLPNKIEKILPKDQSKERYLK